MKVSAVVIVRDGAQTLGRCLASLRGLVGEVVVVDTGSVDSSVAVAQAQGARVLRVPWEGSFAAARNVGLQAAQGAWCLWLDADEYVAGSEQQKLGELVAGLGCGARAYVCWSRSAGRDGTVVRVPQVRLFPRAPGVRWTYRVHEQVAPSLERLGVSWWQTNIEVEHTGYREAYRRREKLWRNLRLLQQEAAERPGDAWVLWQIGLTYGDLGDYEQAWAYGERVKGLAAAWGRQWFWWRAWWGWQLGWGPVVQEALQMGLMRYPAAEELWWLAGEWFWGQGCWAEAWFCWQQVWALAGRREEEIGFGRRELVVREWATALREMSTFQGVLRPWAAWGLGRVAAAQGAWSEAVRWWESAWAEGQGLRVVGPALAEGYRRLGKEQAAATVQAAGVVEGSVAEAQWAQQVPQLLQQRQWGAARQVLESWLAEAPYRGVAWEWLSEVLVRGGWEREAGTALKQWVSWAPTTAAAWYNLAVWSARQGQWRAAWAVLQAGLQWCPRAGELWLLAGEWYAAAGQREEAKRHWRQVLAGEVRASAAARAWAQRRLACCSREVSSGQQGFSGPYSGWGYAGWDA